MTIITKKSLLFGMFALVVATSVFHVAIVATENGAVSFNASIAEAWGDGAGGCCGGGDGDGDGDGGIYIPPPPAPTPSPNCSISASPSSIEQGNSSTLTWSSNHATSATINQGIGSVAVNGSRSVSPSSTTSYTLTVSGPGGTATCATSIGVTAPPLPVLPTCSLSASPSHVSYGGSSTLSWSSSNASSATINNGVGSVGVNGTYVVTNITSDRTYTLTVSNSNGSATCSASVDTDDQPVHAPICDLYASRTSVQPGEHVTLSWSSDNAYSAVLSTFGSVSTHGSRTVRPYHDTTYTLTVTGNGGTRSCSRHVDVYTTPIVHQRPSCTISVSPNSIAAGNTAVLNWRSYNAVSASITPLGGYTALSGSRVVSPNRTTQYFMTVRNAYGETASCATSLGVYTAYRPPVYPTPAPQPIVRNYVPVSHVPYTGPEDTAYALLMIAALVASLGGAVALYHTKLRRRS